jgi:NAD-dependent dihydropyrimidine dehydrogenase PreA subunit
MNAAPPLRVVLYEGEGSAPIDTKRRIEVIRSLLDKGFTVTSVRGAGPVSPADESDVLVLHEPEVSEDPDASERLAAVTVESFSTTSIGGDGSTQRRVHLRSIAGRDGAATVEIAEEATRSSSGYRNSGWKPWFPVIDYDRCTNCMQCLSFCLFDVYGVDTAGQIEVRNEDKCKTNCPACSRVCPEVAILFPKYGSGPINGDEVRQDDVDREKMKVDISALLGGDIYSMLRDRHARATSRFTKERDESKALKERLRCLVELKQSLDIPDEVLMALPSQDQIRRKAAEKAQEGASRPSESQ